jgi:hypothetical protein
MESRSMPMTHEVEPLVADEPRRPLTACPALLWARLTGRRVDLREAPWLRGVTGASRLIGEEYFAQLARQGQLQLQVNALGAGLMARFDDLHSPVFDAACVHPRIRAFYEQTSAYRLDLWSCWSRCIQPFGWLMTSLFSRRLQQLNLPLSPLDPSRGISNDIVQLCEPATGDVRTTGWLRRLSLTGDVLFAGIYSTAQPPNAPGACIKAVYPLPNGNATVFFTPVAGAGGSLELRSEGRQFGDPGFYFSAWRDAESVWVKYVPAMTEWLHVYVGEGEELRADHMFRACGMGFLKLHYAIRRA